MSIIIGLICFALAAGAVAFIAKLTGSFLKSYRKKKTSKLLVAKIKEVMKTAPEMKLDDLDEEDVIVAEYDEDEDELVQDVSIAHDVDNRVRDVIERNSGIVVLT